MAFAQAPRRSTAQRHNPNCLLNPGGETARIWVSASIFKIATASVRNGARVRSPGQFTNVLSIVFQVICNGPGFVTARTCGGLGHPDITRAARIKHPCDFSARRRGSEPIGKRRTHYLFECKCLLLRRSAGRGEKNGHYHDHRQTLTIFEFQHDLKLLLLRERRREYIRARSALECGTLAQISAA